MIRHLEISPLILASVRLLAGSILGAGVVVAALGCEVTPYQPESATTQPVAVLGPIAGANAYGGFEVIARMQFSPASPFSRVYVTQDHVIIYTQANQAFRLSHDLDVEQIKQITTEDDVLHAPIQIGHQLVYPTGITFEFYKDDGTFEKSMAMRSPLTSDAAYDQRGYLIVGTASPTGGRVTVIDPKQVYGTVVMESMPTPVGVIRSTPTSFQGTVYAASDMGKVYAISSDNRAEWALPDGAFSIDRMVADKLISDDYGVYVAGGDSTLYVLDRNTGKIRWRYMAQYPLEEAPLVTGDRVFQIVPHLGLVSLDKLQGKLYREPLWTVKGATQVLSIDDRRIYVLDEQKQVLAVERATGEVKFKGDLSAFDFFATNPLDNTIYALTKDGDITAIKPSENVGLAGGR